MLSKQQNSLQRVVKLALASLLLSGCASTYESKTIATYLDNGSLAEINRPGEHVVSVQMNGEMAGNALVVGMFASVHTYPYDFSPHFENSLDQVFGKIYQNVAVNIDGGETEPASQPTVIIEVEPAQVRLQCFAITEYNYDCIGKTKLNGILTTDQNRQIAIAVEGEQTRGAGAAYGGGADAISASIAEVINKFNSRIYEILTSD